MDDEKGESLGDAGHGGRVEEGCISMSGWVTWGTLEQSLVKCRPWVVPRGGYQEPPKTKDPLDQEKVLLRGMLGILMYSLSRLLPYHRCRKC